MDNPSKFIPDLDTYRLALRQRDQVQERYVVASKISGELLLRNVTLEARNENHLITYAAVILVAALLSALVSFGIRKVPPSSHLECTSGLDAVQRGTVLHVRCR